MPFIPHFASECLKNIEKINDYQWPKVDAKYLIIDSVKIVVQINGKKKDIIEAKSNLSEDELLNKVKDTSKIAKNLEGKEIIKKIIVPNRLINLIIK